MLKKGMKIEATHVKKKQLHHYLTTEILQKRKKQSVPDINRSASGLSKRSSLDGNCLDSSRDTDTGTPFESPSSCNRTSRSDSPTLTDTHRLAEHAPSETNPGNYIPVIGSQSSSAVPVKPIAQSGCSIPTVVGRNVIPIVASPPNHSQGQNHVNGMVNLSPKSSSTKRAHPPCLEGSPKRIKDTEKFLGMSESAFVEPCHEVDRSYQSVERIYAEAMPIPTIESTRSQRLQSNELPDASSPVPTSNIRVIKNSIRLTLNR
ncbi:poly(A) polymerase gamma [Bombina bombina]|uniref:poly(A) polymerase gamma n=1 Tax=Bombina bombina TaxID=8345 RepID=UPI00235A6CA4|nr:poly(A) polymerase gamma [Bombina bombina]